MLFNSSTLCIDLNLIGITTRKRWRWSLSWYWSFLCIDLNLIGITTRAVKALPKREMSRFVLT